MGSFQSFRSNGALQLDSDNMTMTFVRSGATGTQTRFRSNSSPSTVTIPVNPSSTESIAVRADSGYALARCSSIEVNGQWSDIYQCDGPIGTTVRYWVFDRVALKTPQNFGLELFDASGAMTFSSNYRPLVISGKATGTNAAIFGVNGRSYAFFLPFGGRQYVTYDQDVQEDTSEKISKWFYPYSVDGKLYGMKLSGSAGVMTSVSFNEIGGSAYVANAQTSPPPNVLEYDIPLRDAMMVDVTGL